MKMNRTAKRTVEILKLAAKKPEGVTLEEICEELSLPKTSAYDIAATLTELDMLHVKRGQKLTYRIGLAAYRIGMGYMNGLDFLEIIEPELRAFSRKVGCTVFFGVRSDHEVVYICKFEPENPIITTATVGTKNPMYCTSLGKAILAYTDEETRMQVIGRIHFRPKTERTIVSREELEEELALTRERGFAMDAREMEDHMTCVGAPVFGRDGRVLGAISLSSLYRPDEDYEVLGRLISQKAAEISRLLGYEKGSPAPFLY